MTYLIFFIIEISILLIYLARLEFIYAIEISVILCIYLVFVFMERRKGVRVQNINHVLALLTILAHNVLGEFFKLYETSGVFDKLLHLFGTFSMTLFVYDVLANALKFRTDNKKLLFIFTLVLGIALGTFFELIEFAIDAIFKTTNQGGLLDTDLDMSFNLLGALLAGYVNIKQMYAENGHV